MGISLSLLAVLAISHQRPSLPPIPREFRGVWVATVDNIDWPSRRDLSTNQQQREMLTILDKAQSLHLNAIVFQVRPSADALYPSKIEPWSEYLTGQQGRAPSPSWDPLEFAVTEAHKRGLELHAWFNPYRARHPAQKGNSAPNHISKAHPAFVKKYGPYLWMDPGEQAVQNQTLKVILDVVKRYDIDGVHIDDYFYPYREKDPKTGQYLDFPDGDSWGRYVRNGGRMTRGDWRRANVDDFIEKLYAAIKKQKRWVKFGISPFGIYRPGVPPTIMANVDQYADLYADALRWFQNGWCDYFAPQLYWPIKQTPQAFPVLLQWWTESNSAHRHLWPGLYSSRLFDGSPKWQASEVVNQIGLSKESGGVVQFSMKAMILDSGGIDEALLRGPYATQAFVPPSPWLSRHAPEKPELEEIGPDRVSWRSICHLFAVSMLQNGRWTPWFCTSEFTIAPPEGATKIAVVAFDRAGLESPAAEKRLEREASSEPMANAPKVNCKL